jgi:UDP-N-acetyl-D-glucosamine dehydrogenase
MPLTSLDRIDEIKGLVETRKARIGIVGMGYVGLPLALLFSEERFAITGFDIDPKKIDTLNQGRSYIVRIPGAEVQAARENGFRATADYSRIADMDIVMICVPTPLSEYHEPDLSFVTGTVSTMAPYLRERQLIILESTTYPGTTEEVVVPLLEKGNLLGLRVARDAVSLGFYVAFSPEREDPGNNTISRRAIPKVVGGCGPAALDLASAVYATIFDSIVPVSSPAAAEMTKLLENIYRCVNIALVNELKQLCMRMGIDIFEAISAAKTKPFGFQAFIPDPGWADTAFLSIRSIYPRRRSSTTFTSGHRIRWRFQPRHALFRSGPDDWRPQRPRKASQGLQGAGARTGL